MESKLYEKIKTAHTKIFTENSSAYASRTQKAYEKYLKTFSDAFLNRLKGNKIVDLGCGPGRDLQYFISKGYEAIGVDIAPGMIELCKSKNVPAINVDFLSLPFENDSIDGVWAYTSLTLVPRKEFEIILEKISAFLKKGGIFAIGMIEGDYEGWKTDHKYPDQERYVLRLSASELENILYNYFDTVELLQVKDPENESRTYLHALCRKNEINCDPADAAKALFNQYAHVYEERTQTGLSLLNQDYTTFMGLLHEGAKILDLGSGPGRDSLLFKRNGFNPSALDISEQNVNFCLSKGINAFQGNMKDVGALFSQEKFDAIWANCSLTNWVPKEYLSSILINIKELCNPGAVVFIGSVIGGFRGWEVDEKYGGLPRYNTHWRQEELLKELSILGDPFYKRYISQEESQRKEYLNVMYKV